MLGASEALIDLVMAGTVRSRVRHVNLKRAASRPTALGSPRRREALIFNMNNDGFSSTKHFHGHVMFILKIMLLKVASGNAREVLEGMEHALDGIAVAIKHPRKTGSPAPVGLGWDVRHAALLLHLTAHRIAVVTLVTMKDARWRHLLQQCRSSGAIRDLATGQKKGDRSTLAVGQGMDLGRAPTARAANRLVLLLPLPPDAERCPENFEPLGQIDTPRGTPSSVF